VPHLVVVRTVISVDTDVKRSLITDLTNILTEALANFEQLCEEERKIPSNGIFKKWLEMKDESKEGSRFQTVLTVEQHETLVDRGNALQLLCPAQLCEKDDASFLKEFYEWWHEIRSFNTMVKCLLDTMKVIEEKQALFEKATAELSPCYVYMQHCVETSRSAFERLADFARESEKMGIVFSPLAREFLLTTPGIKEDATPLTCVDPTFCVWDRDWNPKVNEPREALDSLYSLEKLNESSLPIVHQGLRELLSESCQKQQERNDS